jgi:hypothetical protein
MALRFGGTIENKKMLQTKQQFQLERREERLSKAELIVDVLGDEQTSHASCVVSS